MKISIIMPTRDAAKHIGRALESFSAQQWENRELIVIDGGSGDGTVEIAAGAIQPERDTLCELQGSNATEALIHGAKVSSGEIIGLLMSDDWLEDHALAAVGEAFEQDPSLEIVCAGARMWEPDGQNLKLVADVPAGECAFGLERLLGVPYTAAYFFRRPLWERLGGYSAKYRYGADRDFVVRAILSGARAKAVPAYSYNYLRHDGSSTLVDNPTVVELFLQDHRVMASEWLQSQALDPCARRKIIDWRQDETLHLARRKILHGRALHGLSLIAPQAMRHPSVAVLGARLLAARARRAFS